MKIFLDGRPVPNDRLPESAHQDLVCFVPAARQAEAEKLGVPGLQVLGMIDSREGEGTRFESHEGFDFACLLVPDAADEKAPPCRVQLYFAPGRLTVVHGPLCAVDELVRKLEETVLTPEQALVLFFYFLTQRDTGALNDIEEGISDFEDQLATTLPPPPDTPKRISRLRRRLLVLKRYYEALFDLLEDMEENTGGLLSKKQLHSLRIQTNRADRLRQMVQNLRDYVTQVREAYQAQMDIQMNKIMELFTVVTTIFLPLTLIVGWYGMNLMMPEYNLPWMYPAVIGVSAAVVVGCVIYFKRRRWF